MEFTNPGAQIFVPDNAAVGTAIRRTTHLAVGAHQDDIPIMAHDGIQQCFGRQDRWFLGITVTDGAGSPRSDFYGNYTDDEMSRVRTVEEKKAAVVGEYGAAVLLDYPSSAAKDGSNEAIVNELAELINDARPEIVYTHNLADKHDTHVAVALRTIAAIRRLPDNTRPHAVYGCEVWRDLDWMMDSDKVALDVGGNDSLAEALNGVFASQIAGGKRYDLATMGRRRANATFYDSHSVDNLEQCWYAMDLTPLVADDTLDIVSYVEGYIEAFAADVRAKLTRQLGG